MRFLATIAINGVIGYVVGLLVAIAIAIPIGFIGAVLGMDVEQGFITGSALGLICKVGGVILFEIKRVVDLTD